MGNGGGLRVGRWVRVNSGVSGNVKGGKRGIKAGKRGKG